MVEIVTFNLSARIINLLMRNDIFPLHLVTAARIAFFSPAYETNIFNLVFFHTAYFIKVLTKDFKCLELIFFFPNCF